MAEAGNNSGILPFLEALSMAREAGLDLVEVDPNSSPPVCRILDYGKWKYQQSKKERDARKRQQAAIIHEVRMRPRIGIADMERKARTIERLLADGDKVKVSVMFRGREMSHQGLGHELLNRVMETLDDQAMMDRPPSMQGRFLSIILAPAHKKREKPANSSKQTDALAKANVEETPVG